MLTSVFFVYLIFTHNTVGRHNVWPTNLVYIFAIFASKEQKPDKIGTLRTIKLKREPNAKKSFNATDINVPLKYFIAYLIFF